MKAEKKVAVSTKLQNLAVKVIDDTFDAYWQKGGIADTEGTLQKQRGSVAENIFGLAKSCKSVEVFKAACSHAEAHLLKVHGKGKADASLSEILPCWRQYKSNIIAAANKGLTPDKFKSEGEMRKALTKARKAAKKAKGAEGEKGATLTPLAEALSSLHDTLSTLPEAEALEMVAAWKDLAVAAAIELAGGTPEADEAEDEAEVA